MVKNNVEEVEHYELISDLIRAMYAHGKIIGEKRLRDFRSLMDKPVLGLSIQHLMLKIATVPDDRVKGFIECSPGETRSTWSVLAQAANMLACYIWKGVQYANKHPPIRPHKRLESAVNFLPALIALDRRWGVVAAPHVARAREEFKEFLRVIDNPYHDRMSRDIWLWVEDNKTKTQAGSHPVYNAL